MSKWKILHGAGDVAVYNGLKKIFHVFPEEAEMVVKILNELEDELARCKEDTPRYVTDEEIDAMYNDDYSSMQFHISIQREAAKAMRDMIFGNRSV
jgi:hypothetical protein